MVASRMRMSVRDIFVEAIALKRQGLAPGKIVERLIDLGQDNGYSNIRNIGGFELKFEETGEVISFDGTDWHHHRP
jgi:hypothetical protein